MNRYLARPLPEALAGLATLALDLRWTWNHGADALWQMVDGETWEATENPWLILEAVSDQRLQELEADADFIAALRQQLAERDAHYRSDTWFESEHGASWSGQIAYFSMEFGLSDSLPIYSGGLGVLAGDHLKTACDLNVPVIGVGLLYQRGYFRQSLDAAGEQIEFYPYNDPTMLPVVPLRGTRGEWVRVPLDLPGRSLRLRTWIAAVGRRTLLLLDSNDPRNEPRDRGITGELYGGGTEIRLQQEMVLGIGGWRLLEQLGMDCPVCHLNEGHAAFSILERARFHMERTRVPFPVALRATRAGNLFTTHTPVPAGFDRFAPELFARYLRGYADDLGIAFEDLLALGRDGGGNADEPFNMAYLAMRGAGAVNAVSRLHGEVSRRIFQPLFPRWPTGEVPVSHVTNGVHVPTWDSPAADELWTAACGKSRWRGALDTVETDLRRIDDARLWRFRNSGRQRLVTFLRKRLVRQECGRGADERRVRDCAELLDPDVLTLGFARRFAEYKRTNLLLRDPDRLQRLLCDVDRPVQLVIAGKAHPQDLQGKRLLREWHEFLERPQVRQRALFVEDYDLVVAAQLTQGIDVWINTPRRPWEASGTSGMKVLVNGGLNLSELDGWWAEAFHPEVGWALGDGAEHADAAAWDAAESERLFELLEHEVVPAFYRRDERGLPGPWLAKVRESMAQLTAAYSSNRMLREYVEAYYLPLARAYRRRLGEAPAGLEDRIQTLTRHWPRVRFGNVAATATAAGHAFQVQVYVDDLPPDWIRVELYAEPPEGRAPECWPLEQTEPLAGTRNAYLYRGCAPADRPIDDYTPRVVAAPGGDIVVPLECSLILWAR